MKIHGRIALVTGGSRGIGRASVLVLAAAGCDVAVNYVHARDEAESLVREIVSRGQRAIAIRADVSREADVEQLVRTVQQALGRIDILVNTDGTVRPRMTDSVTQEVLRTTLTDQRDYTKVLTPALAIYADTFFDVRNGDPAQLAKNLDWEQKYLAPFRAASIERVRRELVSVKIVRVPGTHKDFVFTSREQVVSAMQQFLYGTEKGF